MDFSLNAVDPSLQSQRQQAILSSSLELFALHDFDLFTEGLSTPPVPPSMVYQTIEPSQLTDFSSPSPSPSTPSSPLSSLSTSYSHWRSPSYTSDNSSSEPLTPQPRRNNNSRKTKSQNATRGDTLTHKPYDTEHYVKRHQTKLACTWCRKLSKKCDAQRPCSRCAQFNRCSECVDAPPRKPRAKGVDRGTYKKTRDLATVDYKEAVNRRTVYVAKQMKMGNIKKVGLTADEILEKARMDEARIQKENQRDRVLFPSFMGDVSTAVTASASTASAAVIQGGSLPFTGPLEDLFTCSASPEIEELLLSSPPSSPADSLFDISSLTDTADTVTDQDESDVTSWQWQTMEMFPNVMELVAEAQANEAARLFESEELQRWSDLALVA
jgi:hypothetical protein